MIDELIGAYQAKKIEWLAAVAEAQAAHEARNRARDASNSLSEEESALRSELIGLLKSRESRLDELKGQQGEEVDQLQSESAAIREALGLEERF